MSENSKPNDPSDPQYDVVIVGAGFAGLYMLHKMRQLGYRTRVFEAADDVGGTWYWNRYPGARCDAESLVYSYSFSPEVEKEWTWSERWATQPEILRYINYVADRLKLRDGIQFKTRVQRATYDEQSNHWIIKPKNGDALSSRYFIMATGCLSSGRLPDIKGRDTYKGEAYHTGNWPHDGVDFTGKSVAVIGTGSSGIQAIPEIAKLSKHVTVFQRTPNYTVPARNSPLTTEEVNEFKENAVQFRHMSRHGEILGAGEFKYPVEERTPEERPTLLVPPAEREAIFERKWEIGGAIFLRSFPDTMINEEANVVAADFVRKKISDTVKDKKTADTLTPKDYPIGAKRICVDSDYFATYNRPNVSLVNLCDTPIKQITDTGIETSEQTFDVDMIVYATGFDAMTGALLGVDIRGRRDVSLRDEWAAGPHTYLGLSIAGFPNLFMITGPGSPSVLSNVVVSIEQHVEWIADCLQYMKKHDYKQIEANRDAQKEWTNQVTQAAAATLYMKGNSWYLGANVPGKPRVFMPFVGGVGPYRKICDDVTTDNYRGFHFFGDSA